MRRRHFPRRWLVPDVVGGSLNRETTCPRATELHLMQLVVDSPRCSRRRLLMAFELPTYNYPARISEFVYARVVVIVLQNCLREHPPLRCKRGDMP